MATVKTTNLQHPSATVPNLVLNADGTVDGPGAGGLVAVKHVLKTDAESFTSIAAGGNVAVTGLSITHEVADAANRLIISAFFGVAANSAGRAQCGIAVHDGTGLIAIGDAAGNRNRATAGGATGPVENFIVSMPSVTFVHTPGAGSKTYTVRAVNIFLDTRTLYVNRNEIDSDGGQTPRGASALVIQEVRV